MRALVLLLAAAAAAQDWSPPLPQPAQPPHVSPTPAGQADLPYAVACRLGEQGWLDGYVTNRGQETGAVSGESRFVFYFAGSISRPEMLVVASGVVPAGGTARVARARLTTPPQTGETCEFVVAAFRKL